MYRWLYQLSDPVGSHLSRVIGTIRLIICVSKGNKIEKGMSSYLDPFCLTLFNYYFIVTGEQPLKLAHSLLGYAVGMTDINRPGWPITRK